MKIIEIKGFWGLAGFIVSLLTLAAFLLILPISITWVTWNALVGELFQGPMIEFWQAAILTAAVLLASYGMLAPYLNLEIRQVKSPEDIEKHVQALKDKEKHRKD